MRSEEEIRKDIENLQEEIRKLQESPQVDKYELMRQKEKRLKELQEELRRAQGRNSPYIKNGDGDIER